MNVGAVDANIFFMVYGRSEFLVLVLAFVELFLKCDMVYMNSNSLYGGAGVH